MIIEGDIDSVSHQTFVPLIILCSVCTGQSSIHLR